MREASPLASLSFPPTRAVSRAQITRNHSYALTYSSCHFPLADTSPSFLRVSGKHIHLTQTTNGTAVSSHWHPHHCGLTNRIAVLACQGADSSDFHKGSGALILCVCEIRSDPGHVWPQKKKKERKKTTNMCTRAEVARGLPFTHARVYSCMHARRHIPAPWAQERARESTGGSGVTSAAISTHLSYQHYIRIDWPLHWVVIQSCSVQRDRQSGTSCYFRWFTLLLQPEADSYSPLTKSWHYFYTHVTGKHEQLRTELLYTLLLIWYWMQTDGGHRMTETRRHTLRECSDRLGWGKRVERNAGPQRGELTGGN